MPLSPTTAELLFEVFSQRYERGSTIVTSDLHFEDWTSVLGYERLTGALLDRLTHHVRIGLGHRVHGGRALLERYPSKFGIVELDHLSGHRVQSCAAQPPLRVAANSLLNDQIGTRHGAQEAHRVKIFGAKTHGSTCLLIVRKR